MGKSGQRHKLPNYRMDKFQGYKVQYGDYNNESNAQSCLTLCNPMDYRPPGTSGCGILQARILEWVDIPFSRGSSQATD